MPGYFNLNNRVALVTGASRGLGLAMAEALAEVGATVILNGRDAKARLYRDQGKQARGLLALRLVHGGLRHGRSEGGEGAAR
jgi:NAD(P)-dependent dehydrogenase (short-subunit alcohol dehydrogenase family)